MVNSLSFKTVEKENMDVYGTLTNPIILMHGMEFFFLPKIGNILNKNSLITENKVTPLAMEILVSSLSPLSRLKLGETLSTKTSTVPADPVPAVKLMATLELFFIASRRDIAWVKIYFLFQ